MQEAVTLTPTQSYRLDHTLQVDAQGVPLTTPDPSYASPAWTTSDPTVITLDRSLTQVWSAIPTGKVGVATVTGTETSSDSTKKVLVGTVLITVTGPIADSLDPKGTIVGS